MMPKKRTLGKPPSQRGDRAAKALPNGYDPNDPRYIAIHEAGHAVSAVVLGKKLKKVHMKSRVVPGGLSVGFTDSGRLDLMELAGIGEEVAMPHLVQQFTGPIAELRVHPGARETGAFNDDFAGARLIAIAAICEMTHLGGGCVGVTPEEQKRKEGRLAAFWTAAQRKAEQLVTDHWEAICKVRDLLLKKLELSGEEVAAIMKAAWPS
jgi:ATP-dependent Zn protease